MPLKIEVHQNGPLDNNCILIYEPTQRAAALVDPSFGIEQVVQSIQEKQLSVRYILFTHGHFDHFSGLKYALSRFDPAPQVALHPGDLALWRDGGGSKQFRFSIESPGDPDLLLGHLQTLDLGGERIEVRHTPGHSAGSVCFYLPSCGTVLTGDLLFRRGVGRTDLEDGDYGQLVNSIRSQVFTLPPETLAIPGHGPTTTVQEEIDENPYLELKTDEP